MKGREQGSGRFVSVPNCGGYDPKSRQPEYGIWQNIMQRCLNEKNWSYDRYGGRGITVYPAWQHSYACFLADVGRRPSRSHTIDRIDNNGNYEPGNVRWATPAEQSRNKRSNRPVTFRGETLLLVDWSRRLGVASNTITTRLARGWSVERALTNGARGRLPVPLRGGE